MAVIEFVPYTQTEATAQPRAKRQGVQKTVSHVDNLVCTSVPVTVAKTEFMQLVSDWLTVFVDGNIANIQAIRDFSQQNRSFRFTDVLTGDKGSEYIVDWFNFMTDYNCDDELLHGYAAALVSFWKAQEEGKESRTFEEWYWGKHLGTGNANRAIKITRELAAEIHRISPEVLESKPVKLTVLGGVCTVTFLNGHIWECEEGSDPRRIYPVADSTEDTSEDEEEEAEEYEGYTPDNFPDLYSEF